MDKVRPSLPLCWQVNTDPMTYQSAWLSVMVPPDIDMGLTSGDIVTRYAGFPFFLEGDRVSFHGSFSLAGDRVSFISTLTELH